MKKYAILIYDYKSNYVVSASSETCIDSAISRYQKTLVSRKYYKQLEIVNYKAYNKVLSTTK